MRDMTNRRAFRRMYVQIYILLIVLVVLAVEQFFAGGLRLSPVRSDRSVLRDTYGCSNVGLPKGVIPAGALVTEHGVTRHTTFDAGWAIYIHHGPGVLAAVCRR